MKYIMPISKNIIKAIVEDYNIRQRNFDNYKYVVDYITQHGGQIIIKNKNKETEVKVKTT